MKKLLILLIFVPVILQLQSCQTATPEGYQRVIKSWVNDDINKLLSSWGQPSDVYDKPNGEKLYTYLYTGGTTVTSNYNFILDQINSNKVQWWCQTTFTVNEYDIITKAVCKGNVCIAEEK